MISDGQAKAAQKKLRDQLNRPSWGRGIGISEDPPGSCILVVLVNEMTDEIQRVVPSNVDGVPVRLEVIGDVWAC